MFSCVTFSFSALPFERAVRLIALRELERVDVDCYTGGNHVPAPAIAADPQASAERIRRATEDGDGGVSRFFFSLPYGCKGLPVMALSAVDIALWDLRGKARGEPLYRLLNGRGRESLPVYAPGNEVAWYRSLGFSRFKLDMPYGSADGCEGYKANLVLVERA